MMRDMLMPFLLASRLTVPLTETCNVTSPPSRHAKRSGRWKLEIPTCCNLRRTPRISEDGPFCKSGIEARQAASGMKSCG